MNSLTDPAPKGRAISIVIVNWNTRDILRDCIRSIGEQTSLPHEIIVVDNASTDGSAAMVKGEFPDVTLIANDDNRGFATANNQGLKVATGQKLLLLNPDTIVLDHAIDRMAAWLDSNPDVGCVGCQVLEDETTIQRTSFADPGPVNLALVEFGLQRLSGRYSFLGRPEYSDWDRKSQRDVDVVSGMFMLLPRKVFDVVGYLDEAFFIYSEEADWCRRIRAAGWRCTFVPEAQILHLDGGSKSTSQIRSHMHVQMQKSKMIYVRKHYGPLGAFATRGIFVLASLIRGTIFGLKGLIRATPETKARVRLAGAALRYHMLGREPTR